MILNIIITNNTKQKKKKMARTVTRGIASLSLIIFFISISAFFVLSMIDYSAPHVITIAGLAVGTSLQFGTGNFWVLSLSIPFFFILSFIVSTIFEYYDLKRLKKKDFEKKLLYMYIWPPYKQDVWTLVIMTVVFWSILIGLFVSYQTRFGYNTDVTLNPLGGYSDEMTDRYDSDTQIAITIYVVLMALAFDCIYAYICCIYEKQIAPLMKIREGMKARWNIDTNPNVELIDHV